AGASEIDSVLEDFWGLAVTLPDEITDDMWKEFYDVYVMDKYELGLEEWFDKENPWARQSMNARMLEATRKLDGEDNLYWDASDEIVQNLVKEYVKSVADNGATCCHHTCGNPTLDSYILGVISMPGVISDETASKYREVMSQITGMQSTSAQSDDSGSGSRSSTHPPERGETPTRSHTSSTASNETTTEGGVGTNVDQPMNPSKQSESNYVEGSEMTVEKSEKFNTGLSFSGAPMLGMLLVITLMVIIYWGYRRRR
ncbi:MAG: cobaltochelatase subunit CobN, partial [Euryarchaeota archaeon]|nr:cobaltochelatase subunit CobN [Euryarchaeota archaeon]